MAQRKKKTTVKTRKKKTTGKIIAVRRSAVSKSTQRVPLYENSVLTESYASLFLGLIVVVLAVVLGFSFVKARKHTATSSAKTVAMPKPTQQVGVEEYTVQEGDTLFSIAQAIRVDWTELTKLNNLSDPNNLMVGTKLVIPKTANSAQVQNQPQPTTAPAPTTAPVAYDSYTAQEGDTLWDIAVNTYGDGYKWIDIAKANGMGESDYIAPGTVLKIPKY